MIYFQDAQKQLGSSYSGYVINCNKTGLLNINRNIPKKIPFRLKVKASRMFNYIFGLYSLNLSPLIRFTESLCDKWLNLPLNLIGRAAFFKMFIFPKLSHPLLNLPLLLKLSDVKKLDQALSKFLWQGKKPKISLIKLRQSKILGGLNIPNFRFFNIASLCRYIFEWISGREVYTNPSFESYLEGGDHISTFLHRKWGGLPILRETFFGEILLLPGR
ncbi:hypothetical protein XELAEV_18006012mg [Xenopus laevis]|uniref:Uncharacterized protein n=1 Tax=Xenopus laevis TaxID=8355 RepID=A0A974I3Z1_XENLA|nr:hypothetical protein XELAEV_18006012mg [Xenopus laevis]